MYSPVHVEDFFALDGQNAGQNTFGQTGTENDYIILFIHLYKILKKIKILKFHGNV